MRHTDYIRTPTVKVRVRRDREHPEQIVAELTKSWWGGPGVGGLTKVLGSQWIDATGMSEQEALSAVLVDLGLAMRAGLYEL